MISVNQDNINNFPAKVQVPLYDRKQVKAGIVHIGVGGFHRAHQAFYIHELLNKHRNMDWGICGICLLDRDKRMYDVLYSQDGLYTLVVKDKSNPQPPVVIGSIVEYYFAPDNPSLVINKMADEDIKIISLTITEGGYNFNADDGLFNFETPDVIKDLSDLKNPITVFGYLTAALRLRKELNLPVTIQSCDNIQHNGNVARKMLCSFIERAAPEILTWVNDNVSFPNSMVDRITPVTTSEDREELRSEFGIDDQWPVVTESFHQWIVEDNFKAGRPLWDELGAQFVTDVSPYEKMKIRLLNGGHSLIGLAGYLAGYHYINEVANDTLFSEYLKAYMDEEVTPVLDRVPGIDLEEYKLSLIRRFRNPYIKDSVLRIISESSAKLPKFIVPTIQDNLRFGRSVEKGLSVIAFWYLFLVKVVQSGNFSDIQDQQVEFLIDLIRECEDSDSPVNFLMTTSLFKDLGESDRCAKVYRSILDIINQKDGLAFYLRMQQTAEP